MIEVKHNATNLPCRVKYRVCNPKQAEKELRRFVSDRLDRGYRLRIIPDLQNSGLELGARSHEMLRMAIRRLKELGYGLKERLRIDPYQGGESNPWL